MPCGICHSFSTGLQEVTKPHTRGVDRSAGTRLLYRTTGCDQASAEGSRGVSRYEASLPEYRW